MRYITRAQWGARPPAWTTRIARSEGIFIHYNGPATSPAVAAGDLNATAAFLRGIQNFHMGPQRGWPDIAYSWAVTPQAIYELRGWGVAGAHTFTWNHRAHAIFFPLGDWQRPDPRAIANARIVIAEHNRRYGAGFVKGHRDVNSTACPGNEIYQRIQAGDFRPATNLPIPTPEGVDPNVATPVMMRDPNGRIEIFYQFDQPVIHRHPKGSLWLRFKGVPFQVQVQESDLNAYRFMGVNVQSIDQRTAEFFWRYSIREAPPRMHVRTPDDLNLFRFFGVPLRQVNAQQIAFFRRYSRLVQGG